MRITPIGKVAILLVILGCVAGIYRLLNSSSNLASNQNQSSPQNPAPANVLTLTIQTSGTYQDYLEKITSQWTKDHPSVLVKVLPPKESRDALHFILDKSKGSQVSDLPDIWLASNDALIQNLSSATKSYAPSYANVNDTRTYAIWPPQPMVLLCKSATREKLASLFNEQRPLDAIQGSLKYSFPDPLTSGGGHTALGYCDWSFKQQTKYKDFGAYLTSLKNGGYVPLAAPSGGLASEFGTSQLDFIFVHNALADREVAKSDGRLTKIVPALTVWERPSSIALRPSTGWTPEKEKGLQDFVEYLRRNPPYIGSGTTEEAQVPEHLDIQKQTWERVFDGGARAGGINLPANLPAHPR